MMQNEHTLYIVHRTIVHVVHGSHIIHIVCIIRITHIVQINHTIAHISRLRILYIFDIPDELGIMHMI